MRANSVAASVLALASAFALPGCFATDTRVKALETRSAEAERFDKDTQAEVVRLREQVEELKNRLELALRANADQGTAALSDKERLNAAMGKSEETAHALEEIRKELSSTRTELDKRLDDVKRAQEARAAQAPTVTIPQDRASHYAAIESATTQKDFALTRTLAREYVSRYPADDRVDDVYYLMGDADLKDGRPASAIGEFNRVLRASPPSNVLDKTLFGMGEAYLMMHDCNNAKDAFKLAIKKFAKSAVAKDAQKRLDSLDKPAAGTCL